LAPFWNKTLTSKHHFLPFIVANNNPNKLHTKVKTKKQLGSKLFFKKSMKKILKRKRKNELKTN